MDYAPLPVTTFFATASRGTEAVLADELRALGIPAVEERRGGVAFGASLEDGYRACLWSRIASRILLPLATFEAEEAAAFYDAVHAIDLTAHVGAERTMAVEAAGGDCPAGPPHFLALKAKDAVVDRVRAAEGARPDVDTANPDLRIHLHLAGPRVTVSLDLAGRGLHRRGLDRQGAHAPSRRRWPRPSSGSRAGRGATRPAPCRTRCADRRPSWWRRRGSRSTWPRGCPAPGSGRRGGGDTTRRCGTGSGARRGSGRRPPGTARSGSPGRTPRRRRCARPGPTSRRPAWPGACASSGRT